MPGELGVDDEAVKALELGGDFKETAIVNGAPTRAAGSRHSIAF